MVSSLVELKNAALGDEVDLSDIINRINAIQIIHEKLHGETDVDTIDIRDYIEDLLATLFASFTSRPVTLDNRVPSMPIVPQAALPLGLITNELATNAIEHGFVDDGPARFSVSMSQEDDYYILTIANTGRPFPEGVELANPRTLGLQLVSALVDQLEGSVELTREPTPVFRIRVPRAVLEPAETQTEGS
jgi:two-component sensor histidine kinase